MRITYKKTNPWAWCLAGAVIAPTLILLFSLVHGDASMRMLPILLFLALIGGVAGRMVFALNVYEKSKTGNSGRSARIVINLVVYMLAVFIGFVVARLGPF